MSPRNLLYCLQYFLHQNAICENEQHAVRMLLTMMTVYQTNDERKSITAMNTRGFTTVVNLTDRPQRVTARI